MVEAANVRNALPLGGDVCMVVVVQANRRNPCAPVRPGPKPVFTERTVVMIRADQRQGLNRIARTLGLSVSDIVRWFIDEGMHAIEATESFATLREMKENN